ncbi:MAG TPA: transposase [Chloroflexota bacterium]|nr:transposase [Chloroflexota bacterium]
MIQGLLGASFAGYLISDRWAAYTWIAPERRQVCWAHTIRTQSGYRGSRANWLTRCAA